MTWMTPCDTVPGCFIDRVTRVIVVDIVACFVHGLVDTQ